MISERRIFVGVLAAISGLAGAPVLSGCAHASASTTRTTVTETTSANAVTPALKDDQVAGILVALDATAIQRARIAQERARDPRIRQLADRIVADGAKTSDDEDALLRRVDVTPTETRESVELAVAEGHVVERLRGLSDDAFDDAYLAAEIDAADRTVRTVDRTLIPAVRLDELRRLLVAVRDAADLRLLEAREIRAR